MALLLFRALWRQNSGKVGRTCQGDSWSNFKIAASATGKGKGGKEDGGGEGIIVEGIIY